MALRDQYKVVIRVHTGGYEKRMDFREWCQSWVKAVVICNDLQTALAEAQRLNELNAEKDVHYFVSAGHADHVLAERKSE